jgi:hypothetical protein
VFYLFKTFSKEGFKISSKGPINSLQTRPVKMCTKSATVGST